MNFGNPEKTKKILLFSIIGIVVFAIILLTVLSVAGSMSSSRNNMIIDGNLSKLNEGIVQTDTAGNIYISIERITPLLSYEFFNGEYGKATEDKTKCYVKNVNELTSFEMDSNDIYKLNLASSDSMYDKYTLTLPVKRVDDKLYISIQGLQRAFNVQATYDAEKSVLTINTLPYLVSKYDAQVKTVGYTSLADDFTNQKAILSGLLVVIKDREYYGVLNTAGEAVIGAKYKKIEFMENTIEFLVQSNNKYGILTKEATTKIEPTYDELKVIDNEVGLYLAKSNNKYGVLKRDGNVLLYLEYDNIGVKNPDVFPNDNIKNPYILFDNVIPVQKSGKWGLYGVDGSKILDTNRITTLGCVSTTNKSENYKNVLLIPESEGAEGIVVGVTNSSNNTTYGIFNPQSKRLLTPMTFSKVYRDIANGELGYYMIFGGTISTVKSRITANISEVNDGGTVNVQNQSGTQNEMNTNTIDNSVNTNTFTNETNSNNTITNTTNNILNNSTVETGTNNVITVDPNSTDPIIVT